MWLQPIVLTLLFFPLSTGFGLFILSMASTRLLKAAGLSRLELLVLGLSIGAPGSAIFLQLLSAAQHNLIVDITALSFVALIGLVATIELWRPRSGDLVEMTLWASIAIPSAAMTWWWSFGAFSKFPFTDIGAGVHWMKIAQEFADTGLINPFANQTYNDLRSALAGVLAGTLGLDLLRFNWTYSFFSILCLDVAFYAVAASLYPHSAVRKWLLFFFAAITNINSLLTNGGLALASCFVFLGFLLRGEAIANSDKPRQWSPGLTTAAAVVGLVLAFLMNSNALLLAALPVLLLILNIIGRIDQRANKLIRGILVSLIWTLALVLLHRSSYLFVPITVATFILYVLITTVVSKPWPGLFKAVWASAWLIPALGAAIGLYTVAAHVGYLPKVDPIQAFSPITRLVFGSAMKAGDDITLGAGPENATIEMGRALGPIFAIGIGLMFLWWSIENPPSRLIRLAKQPLRAESSARLLWSWIAATGLTFASLTGFPFLYRVALISLGLFAIATTELFVQLLVEPVPDPVAKRRVVACVASAAATILVVSFYAFGWSPNLPYGGYQAMLRPALLAGTVVALLCAALTFAPMRHLQIAAMATAVALSVLLDRSGLVMLFKVYSYGPFPARSDFVSHYDASDLRTVRWLHDHARKSIVVSDPLTLAMAKAIAGLPGIYLYSNLDTVDRDMATAVKGVLAKVVRPGVSKTDICAAIAPLVSILNDEARTQMGKSDPMEGILKPVRTTPENADSQLASSLVPVAPQDIDRSVRVLETPGGEWRVIAIINPRTIRWTQLTKEQRPSYFPIDEPLGQDITQRLNDGTSPLLYFDGQNAVVDSDCTDIGKN